MDTSSIIAAILAIGILIIFHEAGHMWVARRSGMRVRRFSVGFGPSLAKIERGGTEYQIAALPLGGFVQIDGLNPHDGSDPNAPDSYMQKPVHLRIATIFGGPFANYLIGFALLFLFYAFFYSEPLAPVRVVRVVEKSAAERAGLEKDDLITGTSSVSFDRADELLRAIQDSKGGSLVLAVDRKGEKLRRTLTPEEVDGTYRIGVEFEATQRREKPYGVVEGASQAWSHMWLSSRLVVSGIAGLFKRGGLSRISGPIGMVKSLSRTVQASITEAIAFVGDISIMLGVVNLLPIPSLDGSRLLFLLVGLVRRKPIEPKLETIVHVVGFVMLMLLLVVVSIGDVAR